ncbi:MAG: hypothetical protein EP346_13060 [Bacteroidetes bacterium]|nr:MAG: hypothetical protein EP346_13060 [Bacteroidota bacterium]
METLKTSLLTIHIISGTLALIAGTIAAFARKRRGLHSTLGTLFAKTMYAVGFTGLPMAFFMHSYFLLGLSVFTLFMVYTGSRAFAGIKNDNRLILSIIGFIAALSLIAIGVLALRNSNMMGIASLVFGGILFSMSLREWATGRGKIAHNPLVVHINHMGGSLIAAYTAFFTIGAQRMFDAMSLDVSQISIVFWMLPTIVGSIFLTLANLRIRKP